MPKSMGELNNELKRVFTAHDWLRDNKEIVGVGLELIEAELADDLSKATSDKERAGIKRTLDRAVARRKALEAMEWPH